MKQVGGDTIFVTMCYKGLFTYYVSRFLALLNLPSPISASVRKRSPPCGTSDFPYPFLLSKINTFTINVENAMSIRKYAHQ